MGYRNAIGSNQDIIGQSSEIIGKMSRPQAEHVMRGLRNIDPHAVMVRDSDDGMRRRKVLPARPLTLAAGETASVTFETEELFRPERFVVSSINSEFFDINGIKVGTSDQFAADGVCPAEIFRPDAVDVDVHFKTANVGNKITISVTNNDAGPQTFKCVFIGTAVSGE